MKLEEGLARMATHPGVVGAEVARIGRKRRAERRAADEHGDIVRAVVAHHPRFNLALVDLHHNSPSQSATTVPVAEFYSLEGLRTKQQYPHLGTLALTRT